MKTARYILTRAWLILLILNVAVLFIIVQMTGIMRDDDFYISIGSGGTQETLVDIRNVINDGRLVPHDVEPNLDLNEVNSLDFVFNIIWEPANAFAGLVIGELTVSHDSKFLVDYDGNPLDPHEEFDLDDFFNVTINDGTAVRVVMNEMVQVSVQITLRRPVNEEEFRFISGSRVAFKFIFSVEPITRNT